MDLEAIESIRQLKYRYFRSLDLKLWDEFADTLTDDVDGAYGTKVYGEPLSFTGRDEVTKFMRENITETMLTVHVASHPEIEVNGDTATASWCFEDTVIVPEYRVKIRGAGYYSDSYRRDADGKWRISKIGYTRIYEAMESLDDTPSWKLLHPA
jgi:SnoaL-like domain